MIGTDAHGTPQFLASQDKGGKFLMQSFNFLLILGVSVFAYLKFFPVSIVARIDPYFFNIFSGLHRCIGHEMDISNQGDIHFCLSYHFGYFGQGFRCPDIGSGDPYDFAPGFSELDGLPGSGIHI